MGQQGPKCTHMDEDTCQGVIYACQNFFTQPLLKVEFQSVGLSVCHYFNIFNKDPSNHPRITSDLTHYRSLKRVWHQPWRWQWQRNTHKDKDNDKMPKRPITCICIYFQKAGSSRISDMMLTMTKTKTNVLKRLNVCYVFEKQGVYVYQIWYPYHSSCLPLRPICQICYPHPFHLFRPPFNPLHSLSKLQQPLF